MQESHDVTEIIAHLGDTDLPAASKLAELANLNREELAVFWSAWAEIDTARRNQIVTILVDIAEENVELNFDGIFKLCLKDREPAVRSKAIEGLWENEETSLINPLVDILTSDSSEEVRAAAAMALGRFTLLGEYGKLRSGILPRIKGELLHAFNDNSSSDEVRRRALESLAPLCVPEVTSAIKDAYSGPNQRLRVSALYSMGRSCDPAWLPTLFEELESKDAEMRFEAATALGEIGAEEAVPYLIDLVADPDAEVQLAAIESLGRIGGRKAKEYLESCISSRNQAIRDAAAEALDELRGQDDPLSLQL